MACNAGTELTCISNIDEHVKMQNMPVLPYLLQRWELITSVRFFSMKRSYLFGNVIIYGLMNK